MGRKHADHGKDSILPADRLANDRRIARKTLLPEAVAQDYDIGPAGLVLLDLKSSS